jgi:GntR family transcriptional regulator, transcriptional repressor for pyruvate dehydrogenase complex
MPDSLRQDLTPVYELVQEQILEIIRSGEFRVGDKLPPERALADRLGVSRNSVREAIRGLTEKKILETRRGDGTYVCASVEPSPGDLLTELLKARAKRVKEIFELRTMLEPQIAALAARHITQREINRLKTLIFDQETRLIYGEDDFELDAAFHFHLAEAARNKLLVEVLKTVDHILQESRSAAFRTGDRRRASMRSHYLIVDALERKDPRGAQEAMTLHLLDVEQVIFGSDGQV